MWLIDTDSLKLVEVQGDPQEEYAILSHTWGSDEVTFRSFQALGLASDTAPGPGSGSADAADQIRSTNGFRKIRDAANLAKSHRHRYLWADTCCIDKTSSAELSESINSMYRWYEKAAICYAFLSDVEPVSAQSPFAKDSSFQNSRWFTRGWTLQELIAPKTVEFYAGDWSYINTKQSRNVFCQLLARITGIDEQVLSGTSFLSDISVANKMRWAGHRQTTRPEDKAYCLIGLFKVNMPLLYGEGDRAFTRLQEEILKESDDQSLFLWGMPEDVQPSDDLFGLLASSPSSFSRVDFDHVRPLPPSESQDSAPTSVTNQGLRTNILLIPRQPDGDEYYALLDCIVSKADSSSEEMSPCIILQRLWSDQFARVASEKGSVILFPLDHFDDAEGTYENIYVKENPFYALPELSVKTKLRPNSKDAVSHLAFTIHEAYPPERWDTTLSVIRTKEPHSNRAMVVLRFMSLEQSQRSVVDVAIGLRRVRRRWEVCYEKHPYTGNSLESVYLEFSEIATTSDGPASYYQNSKGLGFITIDAKESQRRGRRFIQLEVSGTSELLFAPSDEDIVSSTPRRTPEPQEPVTLFDEVGAVTRCCCYQDRFTLMLAPTLPIPEGVRTKTAVNIAIRFGNELHAVKIEQSKPYADLIRAVRARSDRDVQSLARQRRGLLELRTEEFDDFRAIHWAATLGSLSMLKTLLKLGANTMSQTRSGFMAVHLAVLNGHFNLAAYLLEEERESNLKKRPDILQGITTEVLQAEAEIAFYSGTDPDILHKFTTKRLETILHLFSAYAPAGLANHRIRKIVDLIKEDFLGSHSFPHINDLGELPLHRAAATGNMQAVDALTKMMGTTKHIDARDNAGRSVLFHAACGGSKEVIRGLADLGASIDVGDDYGRSPLHAAVMADQPSAANALLKLGAKADNVTHALGLTPLHFACLYGSIGCTYELLKSDGSGPANLNRWSSGEYAFFQPIHLAVANDHVEIVTRLVMLGCDLEGRCNGYLKLEKTDGPDGRIGRLVRLESPLTALDLAIVLGKKDMLPELQQTNAARRYE
ncbi:hypothetical protein CLIM01_01701 [Colletotrichum limetticola]|uniref:Heterokaryon incompatibility domain-containing protein n=1 Tax=Colletotrichum limetticola TaxID=1209924 RepID=A0ABQ9QAV3_9PEZI|nr:hypothetical protein CLIM01_01701 [Colletotrichum limetticola]